MFDPKAYIDEKRPALLAQFRQCIFPSEDELMAVYALWTAKMEYWTIREAAALIMRADPRYLDEGFDFLEKHEQNKFDMLLDGLGRKFGAVVDPAELLKHAHLFRIENDLLWSAIDHFRPSEKAPLEAPPRKSDESRKQASKDKILYALLRHSRSLSDDGKINVSGIKTKLELTGMKMDEDTILEHVRQVKSKFDPANSTKLRRV